MSMGRGCGEIMRRGTKWRGVHGGADARIPAESEDDYYYCGRRVRTTASCHDGGVIRMAGPCLRRREDYPSSSAILFPRVVAILDRWAVRGTGVIMWVLLSLRPSRAGGEGRRSNQGRSSRACQCEDRVYRQRIAPRASCQQCRSLCPRLCLRKACPLKRSDDSLASPPYLWECGGAKERRQRSPYFFPSPHPAPKSVSGVICISYVKQSLYPQSGGNL
jgi:hypothetical protein